MPNNEDYDFFMDNLIENACKSFHKTRPSQLLQEKLEKMDDDCKSILPPTEREFAEKCFSMISEVSGEREAYLYHQGMKDCVWLLKNLGVLV